MNNEHTITIPYEFAEQASTCRAWLEPIVPQPVGNLVTVPLPTQTTEARDAEAD